MQVVHLRVKNILELVFEVSSKFKKKFITL